MARFQILAFDGGGIRGAFGVGFLHELESQTGRNVGDCFDLIAGTSTGAITALGLGIGLSGQELADFYHQYGRQIFTQRPKYEPSSSWLKPIYPWIKQLIRKRSGGNIDHFFRARYCPHNLQESLRHGFGDRLMKDIVGPRVIVPSINLTEGRPHVFGTPHIPRRVLNAELRILDVLMATTAAPTYFPHHVMPDGCAYADGGLWAGSPGILALAEALRLRQLCEGDHCAPPFSTSEIYLLTVGTGTTKFSLTPPGADAGSLYWAQHIADVMMSSQVQGIEVPLRFLLADRLKNINFELPNDTWKLDSIDRIDELFERGREAARENLDDLGSMFMQHDAPPFDAVESDGCSDASDINDPAMQSAL